MTKTQWSRAITVSGALLVALALVLGLTPSPAGSATQVIGTARAEAEAIEVSLLGATLIDPGPRTADTTRTPVEQGPTTGDLLSLPLLGDFLAAGLLAQEVEADEFGNSVACAGLVGPGGQLNISADTPPDCVEGSGAVGDADGPNFGLVANVGVLQIRLGVDAVIAKCQAGPGAVPQTEVEVIGLEVAAGVTIAGIFVPVGPQVPRGSITASSRTNLTAALSGIVDAWVHDPVPTGDPLAAEIIGLNVQVAGGVVAEVPIGRVRCGANSITTARIDFDTSGSLGGEALQPNTDNALGLSYSPDVDRPNVTLEARLSDPVGVIVDPDRPLPAGCTVSIDGTVDPDEEIVLCPMGPVAAGETASAVIPVEITDAAADAVTAELLVYGASLTDVIAGPVEESAAVLVERTSVAGDAGDLVVPDPNRTGLPEDIPGTLYLDVPHYVEQAAYGGTPCALDPDFDPAATVYPAVSATPANVTFDCGSSIPAGPGSADALAFTYADDAPETAGTPDLGRVVIIRDTAGGLAEVPPNSYYADLDFFVDEAAPVTTTSTSTTSTSTPTSSSTTSSTTPSSTSSTSSTTPSSTSSTSSTTPSSTSSSSSTTPSSTSSTVGPDGGATTSTTARPLARTGSDTRTTMSIALGLLGAGMVVTGRGMQAEVSILSRRRRS